MLLPPSVLDGIIITKNRPAVNSQNHQKAAFFGNSPQEMPAQIPEMG